jgi:hypothetical protein
MANTMTLIASSTVGAGGASTISFSSIPSTYTDLCVKLSTRAAATGWTTSTIQLTFNGVGGTSYSRRTLYNKSDGTGGSDSASSVAYIAGIGDDGSSATSNTFANNEFYIPNYAGSNYKSVSIDSVVENNGTDTAAQLTAGLFSNTSAISSLSILDVNGNFVQYSTAYLYGVKNA